MDKSKVVPVLKAVGIWTVIVLLGALFAMQGIMRLAPGSPWPQVFERFGYPDGFYLVVGFLELLGGILLFIPRFSSYGGLVLGVVMVGACGTHLVQGEMLQSGVTLTLALIFFLLAYGRRPARIRELQRTRKERWSKTAPI